MSTSQLPCASGVNPLHGPNGSRRYRTRPPCLRQAAGRPAPTRYKALRQVGVASILASASSDPVQRRLRVFIAAPGKQLFTSIRDPRLRVYPGDFAGVPTPDLVVYPCSQHEGLAGLQGDPPPSVLERIRSGKARVVFDASGEGHPHSPALTAALHGLLERLGAPRGRAVYITQNRTWNEAYLAHCARDGPGRPMSVLTYDFWIRRFFAPFEATGEALLRKRRRAFTARTESRKRRFISLNWSPRPSKVFFLLRVMRDGLWDRGYISFGGFAQLQAMGKGGLPQLNKAMRALPGFEDLYAELLPYLKRLDARGRVQLGDVRHAAATDETLPQLVDDVPLAEYGQSWFSVVTESEMWDTPARITEKPFKPLVNFHPIVVFGNPGALRLIRGLGFETFPEVFDESYDEEPDQRRRFEMAYGAFARLCRMEPAQLAQLEARIADKLDHNARFGLTELPRLYREEIDAALIAELAEARPHMPQP